MMHQLRWLQLKLFCARPFLRFRVLDVMILIPRGREREGDNERKEPRARFDVKHDHLPNLSI